jgi:hypothetical protein
MGSSEGFFFSAGGGGESALNLRYGAEESGEKI